MEIKLAYKNKIIGVIDKSLKLNKNTMPNVILELASTKKSQKKIKDSLKLVGLSEDILYKDFSILSSSEVQKVLLAKTLLKNEKKVILENPTLFLDSNSKKNLIKLVKMMKVRYNKTIIILSNDIEFLHKTVDYIVIIDKGNVVLEGSKYEVFSNDAFLKKYSKPLIMQFSDYVKENKGINMGYRDDNNDLMKDIYRFADRGGI